MNKWEIVPSRSRLFNTQMYVAGIAEVRETTTILSNILLYCNNELFLKQVVSEHNKLCDLLEKDKNIK